ncbi:MFS transporter [Candidatus Pandoraea novymonadis]|uniref:Multidrug transporter MdfA n=1 Tax=Candidatus Pandoraea novymonadis TaxID=1808959 RepID=A0ABX5FDV4_9BURK|nr:MFS transporter [Candidatus Pandoraea novymonadis]PSB91913.1 Multidrug transporter MdfA [Candidatus Pandoraea novymonadis]
MTVSRFYFPLSLVAFEFAVYVSNDMIMPGMPLVIREFGTSSDMTTFALTAAMLGNASLQWLLGPLADRYGRRRVLLSGLVMFIVACISIHWVHTMQQFIVLRFFQGMGCCFVLTVGYPTVHEAFEEKKAIRVMALMANVSLLSPLFGPLAGAAIVSIWPWRSIFWFIAILSVLSLLGLYRTMPELSRFDREIFNIGTFFKSYWLLLRSRRFLQGAILTGILATPLLSWIGLGPIFLIERAGLGQWQYALLQIPVFVALGLGNLFLAKQVGHLSNERFLEKGVSLILIGAFISFIGTTIFDFGYMALLFGISLHALGMGMSYGIVYRQSLFVVDSQNRATIAGMLSMITIVVAVAMIESIKVAYLAFGDVSLGIAIMIAAVIVAKLATNFMKAPTRDAVEESKNVSG